MRTFTLVVLAVVALTAASAEEAGKEKKAASENDGKSITRTAARREDLQTTWKSPQVYSYRSPAQGAGSGSIYPSSYYPSNVIPSSYYPSNVIPSSYYPSNGIPSKNPSIVPTVYPYTPRVGDGSPEAFTARRASSYTTAGGKVFFAEGVTQQVGSGWNTATSEFLAPSSGVYFFTFAAMSDRYTNFRVSLIHNGAEVVSAYGDADGYQMGSQSAVIRLNAGDRVYLQLQEGRLYDVSSSRAYNSFSGFKVL